MGNFETSRFGNGVLVGSGGNVVQNVRNFFGDRDSGETVGNKKTEGSYNELVLQLTGQQIRRGGTDEILVPPVIKAGFRITGVYARVTEVFVVTGTSPVLRVGTQGSEATNGFQLTEAQLEALGTYDLTSTLGGTWAAAINADTTVGIALAGTTPAVTDVGRVEIVVTYIKV